MGKSEETKSAKAEKQSSSASTDQSNQNTQANLHVYPDWAAMQAYYGPRVTLPPYYNSAMASGHSPHPYMWPPQPMMPPPYGAPYAAIYSHGGVYAHPAVPLTATPPSTETPTKSSGNTDGGLVKKLKGFDALVMTIGNGNGECEGGGEHKVSQSFDTEASSDGSDGNTSGANQPRRKRSREETSSTGTDGKAEINTSSASGKEAGTPVKAMEVGAAAVPGRPVLSPGMTTALELRNTSAVNAKATTLPSDAWLQNERELKRERRKQSNRESARRSRLRKQAETEELARKVESLTSENVTLKSEINRLTESSEKLRTANAAMMEKLKNAHLGQTGDVVLNIDNQRNTPRSTENLLSRVNNNSTSNDRSADGDGNAHEKKSNSSAKLHQLLDTSPRADAVAAG